MLKKKTILVAPLNWGLGHATRCIPMINALLKSGFEVLLASDGGALLLLKKEFPELEAIELPPYDVKYSTRRSRFKMNLLLQLPKLNRAITAEKKVVAKLFDEGRIDGIISDNRLGIRHSNIPSVVMTHQVQVLSGKTTKISTRLHIHYLKKFNECWVPDINSEINFSGKMGHFKKCNLPLKYIGLLSRMKKIDLEKKYDILALLSGPEPQRTILQNILLKQLKSPKLKVLMVKGVVEENFEETKIGNITIFNFLKTEELEKIINESELILSRPGYTTIMDLAAMGKKAFFIPTPGQGEQEYLAKRLKRMGIAPSCKQENFKLDKLEKVKVYKGLKSLTSDDDLSNLFKLFEGERKL